MIKGFIGIFCLQLFWLQLAAQDLPVNIVVDSVAIEEGGTGVEKYSRYEKLLVLPDASPGVFTVKSTQVMKGGILTVVNSEDEEVMHMPDLNGNPVALNLASLPKGIYLVRISTNENLYAAPLIFE